MDEYVELLILAYFREYKEQYNLTELKDILGMSYGQLDSYLDQMLTQKKLSYKNRMLQLAEKGLIQLVRSEMKEFKFQIEEDEPEFQYKVYEVHGFSKKQWRGSR